MSFLAPFFLVGALAIAGPILFHLMRRSPQKKRPFSTLMFLEPDPPEFSRKSRISNWFLLFIRCLLILLICLAFSRPFFPKEDKTDSSDPSVLYNLILVDTSASMSRSSAAGLVEKFITQSINDLKQTDMVAFATFESDFHLLFDWRPLGDGDINQEISLALQESTPTYGATRLGASIVSAAEHVEERLNDNLSAGDLAQARICVISDFQKGASLDGLQGYEWHSETKLKIMNIGQDIEPNSGLALLNSDTPGIARIQILNDDENLKTQFQVDIIAGDKSDGEILKTYQVSVPSGSSRIINIPMEEISATHGIAKIKNADSTQFDNTVYWVNAAKGSFYITTLHLGDLNDPKNMLFYLNRAFGGSGNSPTQIIDIDNASQVSNQSRFLVAAKLDKASNEISFLKKKIEEGLDVLYVPENMEDLGNILRIVSDDLDISGLKMKQPKTMAMLSQIDWGHPVFSPFDDPQFNNFSSLGFTKYFSIPSEFIERSDGYSIAQFEDESPWICEWKIGQGNLWLMTSGWKPDSSLFARSSKFVPIILSLSKVAGAWQSSVPQYYVNQSWLPLVKESLVNVSEEESISVKSGKRFAGVQKPGFVSVKDEDGSYLIPVNVDPRESLCSSMALTKMDNYQLPIWSEDNLHDQIEKGNQQSASMALSQKDFEIEESQKNWKWILAAVMILIVFETWLAGFYSRSSSPQQTA